MTGKPLPVADETSVGYWDAAARGTLALPRCAVCGRFAMPPWITCPACGASDPRYQYVAVDGSGTIRSWTVVRDAFLPGFADDVPYVLVDVELDVQAGLHTIVRLVDGPAAPRHFGERVALTFDGFDEGGAVPSFGLA